MCPYPTCTTSTACTAIRPNTPVIGALSPPSSSAAFPRFPASSTTSLQQAMVRPAYLWAVNTCKPFLSYSLSPHATCLQRAYPHPISSTTFSFRATLTSEIRGTGSASATSTPSSPPASSTGASTVYSHTPTPSWTIPRRARISLQPTTPRMWRNVVPVVLKGGRVWLRSSSRFSLV